MDKFKRDIAGALREAINAHGPITPELIGSATKRVAAGIRGSLKRERDLIAASTPRSVPHPEEKTGHDGYSRQLEDRGLTDQVEADPARGSRSDGASLPGSYRR